MLTAIKFPLAKNLNRIETIDIEDKSINSEKYFNISKCKSIYGLGYHSILLRGSTNLRKFSQIEYEMFDTYGQQIKCHVRGNNLIIGLTNTIISFYIESTHSNGEATFILVGTSKDYKSVENSYNIRWKINLTIDRNRNNDDDLIFYQNPAFDLNETAEGIVGDNGQEVTITNITSSLLAPFSGKLESIALYTRLSNTKNDFSLATTYKLIPETQYSGTFVDTDITDYIQYSTSSQIINEVNDFFVNFSIPLTIITKPTYYDMKMSFYDGKNELCRDEKENNFYIIKKNIPFSGVGDASLLKYDNVIGAVNVEWVNAPIADAESGTLATNNSAIELSWTDLKILNSTAFPLDSNDIYGISKQITYNMGYNVQKYAVWMFISDTKDYSPLWLFPGRCVLYNQNLFNQSLFNEKSYPTPDGLGNWFFKGFYSTNYANIDVPKNKSYSFWVGFITKKTNIPALSYYKANEIARVTS